MIKKGRFFKKTASKKRTYNQEIGIIRTNVKVQIIKVFELFKKLKGLKYVKS